MREFDFIVIGSVTAGQKAAIQGAKSGKNVCLVETTSQVGGMCVHRGTILSKALRESAQRYMNAHKLLNKDQPTELPPLMANVDRVIQGHDEYIFAQLKRISIDCIESRASLKDAQVLSIHYDRI
jgi:NAD(P) transhydrogenase